MSNSLSNFGGIYSLYGLSDRSATTESWESREYLRRVILILPKILTDTIPVPSTSADEYMINSNGYDSGSNYADYLDSFVPAWRTATPLYGYGDEQAPSILRLNRALDTFGGLFSNGIDFRDYMSYAALALWDDTVGHDALAIITNGAYWNQRINTTTGIFSGMGTYSIPYYGVRNYSNGTSSNFMAVKSNGDVYCAQWDQGYGSSRGCQVKCYPWHNNHEQWYYTSFNINTDTFFAGLEEDFSPFEGDLKFKFGTPLDYSSIRPDFGTFYYTSDNKFYLGSEFMASEGSLPYTTQLPAQDNSSGILKVVVVDEAPSIKYNGYLYIVRRSE